MIPLLFFFFGAVVVVFSRSYFLGGLNAWIGDGGERNVYVLSNPQGRFSALNPSVLGTNLLGSGTHYAIGKQSIVSKSSLAIPMPRPLQLSKTLDHVAVVVD